MADVVERLRVAFADRYRIERELGAGGMATVYFAEDLRHHRNVAVKVLRPDLAASLGPERFLREVTIAANLQHPHVLPLYDSGQADGFLYYVMPYVEGTSLRQKLQRAGELPIPEAVRILRDLADALAYAHGHGVVHRDIKPENVMLVERHALVMDFGVAKAVAAGQAPGGTGLTSAGVALGTPAYMAPEQAAGETHVDHRADLYAWGVVAYELLAGQPPFVRATPQTTLAAQVTATPEPVTHHRANVPGALARLVMQCLEKKAADRPQSAEEVLRQLDQVLTPSGGLTPTDTRPYQTAASRRARRQNLLVGAVTLVGLGAIGVLGWRWWQNRAVPLVPERVVIAPWRNESGQPERASLGWQLAEAASGVVSREGVTEPVPLATVREYLDTTAVLTTSELRRLSRQTGAGLVVSGSYRVRGDSVEVRTELLRMPAGAAVYGLAAITGGASEPAVLTRVGEQVALALQLNKDWGDTHRWGVDFRMPASLAAYRAWIEVYEASWVGVAGYEAPAREAMALDSTFPQARLIWAELLPDYSSVVSYLSAEARPGYFNLPGDRDDLASRVAAGDFWGDHELQYQLAKRQYARSPEEYRYWLAWSAYKVRRMHEVVRLAQQRDAPNVLTRRGAGEWLWRFHITFALALHALGRYEEELAVAREMRAELPTRSRSVVNRYRAGGAELEAAAALGRVQDAETAARANAGVDGGAGEILVAAEELQAHGFPQEGQRLCAREASRLWDGGVRQRLEWNHKSTLYELLWCAGRADDAAEVARELILDAKAPVLDGVRAPELRGVHAARTGNGSAAYALVDTLLSWRGSDVTGPPSTPVGVWIAAPRNGAALRILCVLGDTARAEAQFLETFALGYGGVAWEALWHRNRECDLIRNRPAVVALTRVQDQP